MNFRQILFSETQASLATLRRSCRSKRGCGVFDLYPVVRTSSYYRRVASAALYVLGTLIYLYSPSSEEDIPPILNYMEPIYLLLLLVGALAAIAGVHALQRERYGLWGAAASLIAFVGVTLFFGFLGALVDLLAEQHYRAVT